MILCFYKNSKFIDFQQKQKVQQGGKGAGSPFFVYTFIKTIKQLFLKKRSRVA